MLNRHIQDHAQLLNNLRDYFTRVLTVSSQKTGKSLVVRQVITPPVPTNDVFSAQQKARSLGLTYSKPIKVELELKKDGKVIDRDTVTVMQVPEVTQRGTYIMRGNEYAFPYQKRLVPGVYTKKRPDGTAESWINTDGGASYVVWQKPTGMIYLQPSFDKAPAIELVPLAIGMGVSPQAFEKALGKELLATNLKGSTPAAALSAFYEAVHYPGSQPEADGSTQGIRKWIEDYWSNNKMEADTNAITLGKKAGSLSADLLVDIVAAMMGVARDEREEDNKESLLHAQFSGLDDYALERLGLRENRRNIERRLMLGLERANKVSEVVGRDIFQAYFDSTFTKTDLSRTPKQTNPMDMLSGFTEVTLRGEGGIQLDQAVTKDVRALDPSHLGFFDPVHTPEGSNIGTTMHMSVATRKRGRDLETQVVELKTGKLVWMNPRQLWAVPVAFADFYKNGKLVPGKDGRVEAMWKSKEQRLPAGEVTHAFYRTTDMFGPNTLGIPFLGNNNGTRVMTGSKMSSQAKPLKYREAPLVQCAVNEVDNTTVEGAVGRSFVPKSPVDGTVKSLSEAEAVIKGNDGTTHKVEIPRNFWLNEGNFVDAEFTVKVGDKVKAGQPIADTNYTKGGQLALGVNLRVAYVPYKGYNHEDGVVISESAATKLTSLHAPSYQVPIASDEVLKLVKFRAYFPSLYSSEQLDKLDEEGVIKKGERVKVGDPLVVKMRRNQEDVVSKQLKSISRLLSSDFRETTVLYDKDHEGVVTEVTRRRGEVYIVVRTEEAARVGDKLVGRYGNKGTITMVLPDKDMPKDEEGRVLHVLLNPSGVPARMNMGQVLETNAARVAEKTGKTYVARPFGDKNTDRVLADLKQHGMSDTSKIYDPVHDQWIEGVTSGIQYILKLEHQVEKKLSARGAGADEVYSLSGQPSSGGGTGGRAVGLNEIYALLSHGANTNLAAMFTYKGDQQPEVWRAVEQGYPLPPPDMPTSSVRMVGMLRAMGVNLEEHNHAVKMTPFLDRDIKKITNGEIKQPGVLRADDLKEEKGGLFDLKLTGGLVGERWTHIKLAEPMPHPTFEKAIMDLLHLPSKDFDDIMAGRKGVLDGKVVPGDTKGAIYGGKAVRTLLGQINVEERIKKATALAEKARGSELNKLHRELRTLRNLRDNDVKPSELVVELVPVMPPKFRPVAVLPNDDLTIADVNEHYRSLIVMNNLVAEYGRRPGMEKERAKLVGDLYEGTRGVMGFSTGLVGKPNVRGIASTLAGSQPKHGWIGSKLLRRRQDTSGTGVVEPDPKLPMDEIGIPEEMAWKIFAPHITAELRGMGLTALSTKDEISKRSPSARRALELAMQKRVVFANRAPTLHKFGFMAFQPKLVAGSAIKVPIEVLAGYGADFDGDTFGIHVTGTDAESKEAREFFPSKNLYAAGRQRSSMIPQLSQEFILGLWRISRPGKTTTKSYVTPDKAIADLQARRVQPNDIVSLRGKGRTTPGLILVMEKVPTALRDYQTPLDKKQVARLLEKTEKQHGTKAFLELMEHMKHTGALYAYLTGASVTLSDMKALSKDRDAIYRAADAQAEKIRSDRKLTDKEREAKLIEVYSKADSQILSMTKALPPNSAGRPNNLTDQVVSGARGNPNQVKQVVGAIGLMMDHRQQVIAEPVKENYSEGLSSAGFWRHSYSQRKGMIDKSQSVIGPGALSKELTNTASRYSITTKDCRTTAGRMEPVDRHLIMRVLGRQAGNFPRNTIIDEAVYDKLVKAKLQSVFVRSVLTCEAPDGICAMCFGLNDKGRIPEIGEHVGISEVQAMTERAVQLPMKSFHHGGVASAGAGVSDAFSQAVQILRMPSDLKGKAILAVAAGTVTKIEPNGKGGQRVMVGNKAHDVPPGSKLIVKVGDQVNIADKLTMGPVSAHDLLPLKGLDAVQGRVRDDLYDTFVMADVKLHKRTYEVMTRGLTDSVRVVSAGDCPDFMPGDYTTFAKVRAWNSQNPGKKPITFNTELAGSLSAPQRQTDWAQRAALGRIQQTLQEGAAMGYSSARKPGSYADIMLGPKTKIAPAGREFQRQRW